MKRSPFAKLLYAVLVVSLAACAPKSTPTVAAVEATPTRVPPTATPPPTATLTATLKPTATTTATITPTLTDTPDLAATSAAATDVAYQATKSAQATLDASATQAAEEAEAKLDNALWKLLTENGDVSVDMPKYQTEPDFSESWAQINFYRWWPLPLFESANFVVSAHIAYESAFRSAEPWAGCGYVFRLDSKGNHMIINLTTHGQILLASVVNHYFSDLGGSPIDYSFDVEKGEADVVVVANKEIVSGYVNGKRVFRNAVSLTNKGALAFTLISGTNVDYGTACTFTKVKVWDLDQ